MPITLKLSYSFPKRVLALGGELKSTICSLHHDLAFLSDEFGDLSDYLVYSNYLQEVQKRLAEGVDCVAYDMHPNYLSHRLAHKINFKHKIDLVPIQHHQAHVASCAAAQNIWHSVIGLAFDGTGYGTDNSMWGGEFFVGNIKQGFGRVGHFRTLGLAGNDKASKEPWRLALDLLMQSELDTSPFMTDIKPLDLKIVSSILKSRKDLFVRSSSLGRLFDGVAALLGVCHFASYEAQAAIALEQLAADAPVLQYYPIDFASNNAGLLELDWRPMIVDIVKDLMRGVDKSSIAAAFHDSLAVATAKLCLALADHQKDVVASGGVFFNKRFTCKLASELNRYNLNLIVPKKILPSDASISFGQAVLATQINSLASHSPQKKDIAVL